jgi:hypothetical protein
MKFKQTVFLASLDYKDITDNSFLSVMKLNVSYGTGIKTACGKSVPSNISDAKYYT